MNLYLVSYLHDIQGKRWHVPNVEASCWAAATSLESALDLVQENFGATKIDHVYHVGQVSVREEAEPK